VLELRLRLLELVLLRCLACNISSLPAHPLTFKLPIGNEFAFLTRLGERLEGGVGSGLFGGRGRGPYALINCSKLTPLSGILLNLLIARILLLIKVLIRLIAWLFSCLSYALSPFVACPLATCCCVRSSACGIGVGALLMLC
jgi:hypothetical protein